MWRERSSFDDVKITAHTVTKHVRSYMQARKAFLKLFDEDDPRQLAKRDKFAERYKVITQDDLKVNTTVVEPFADGLRNIHASWIWHFEDPDTGNADTGEDSFVVRRKPAMFDKTALYSYFLQCGEECGCVHARGS